VRNRSGEPTGSGFVEFDTIDHATEALNELNGRELEYGIKLNLNYARPARKPTGGRSHGGDWQGRGQSNDYGGGGRGGGYQRGGGGGGRGGGRGGYEGGRGGGDGGGYRQSGGRGGY